MSILVGELQLARHSGRHQAKGRTLFGTLGEGEQDVVREVKVHGVGWRE